MKQSWFARSFGWIGDDVRRTLALLKEPEAWIFLGITGVFALIVYICFQFALKLDFTMRLRHLSAAVCREMGNASTAFLFFGTVFLALTISMMFGEFAHHLDYKRRKALAQARQAAFHCAGWGASALAIGLTIVIFLQSQCL